MLSTQLISSAVKKNTGIFDNPVFSAQLCVYIRLIILYTLSAQNNIYIYIYIYVYANSSLGSLFQQDY